MKFNSEDYLEDQLKKQFDQEVKTTCKQELNRQLFEVSEELEKKVVCRSIEALQQMVRQQVLTYADITECFWNRAVRLQEYNAVISLNPDVVKQAEKLSYSEEHGPLYGMPVLIKDNICTEGMPTTAGAAVLQDFVREKEAELISNLKEAGALILGKANLTEWANFMSTDSSNGYSAVGGQTRHAHGRFDVGGSSAGSSVAVALCMAPVAVGTETAGSIIYPASQNGVVGLKPTQGLIAQDGIIPISVTQDTAGPMAKTVKDTYALLQGMTTLNEELPKWNVTALDACKVGVIDNLELTDTYRKEDERIIEEAEEALDEAGAIVREYSVLKEALTIDYLPVLKHEFSRGVSRFFSEATDRKLTLEEVITFNEEDMEERAPFNQELLIQSVADKTTPKANQKRVDANCDKARAALDQAFEEVDVLLTLSNYATSLYVASGYPAVTLPGFKRTSGEPVGVTLIGQEGQDVRLLEMAYALEQAISHHVE
ncbi:amidase family protein [Alkalibacterium sp. AK22]|uniref:amidase family protein n=1 Tax=Alkalibacterium sp. AK22 TaxID=1229520 RepID=UPI000688274F|nr:amidase family protein [Alkalibacterium sp. AK22]